MKSRQPVRELHRLVELPSRSLSPSACSQRASVLQAHHPILHRALRRRFQAAQPRGCGHRASASGSSPLPSRYFARTQVPRSSRNQQTWTSAMPKADAACVPTALLPWARRLYGDMASSMVPLRADSGAEFSRLIRLPDFDCGHRARVRLPIFEGILRMHVGSWRCHRGVCGGRLHV